MPILSFSAAIALAENTSVAAAARRNFL